MAQGEEKSHQADFQRKFHRQRGTFMNLKAIVLPCVAGFMLCSVYLLPEAGEMSPSAIKMELPSDLAGWLLQKKPPTDAEIEKLAADTTFSKATCWKAREGEYQIITGEPIPDRLDLSIVLSGHNLNDSIHRPERCMPAQGHKIFGSTFHSIKLDDNRVVPLQRLLSIQAINTDETYTKYRDFQCVTYYFFVGHHTITSGHYERTLLDMKDRLLLGMDQRWAYVSVSMWYGDLPWIENDVPVEEADRKIQAFIKELAAEQIDWGMLGK